VLKEVGMRSTAVNKIRAFALFRKTVLSVLCWVLACFAFTVSAEPPEGLDFIGGYYDKGEYKCYSEPCFTIHKGTEAAASRNRPFSKRDWVHRKRGCQKAYTKALAKASRVDIAYAKKNECIFVVKGEWEDPYTTEVITDIRQIALDQLVSFKEAHRYGGAYWTTPQRMALVNDADNIVPVAKASKKARDGQPPTKWMPDNKKYWCDYIVRREIIQRKYGLYLPREEREFNEEVKKLYCKY
jgi:hypothetical protein